MHQSLPVQPASIRGIPGQVELKLQQDHQRNQLAELNMDKRSLLTELKEMETSQNEMVSKLRQDQEREVHNLRVEHDRRWLPRACAPVVHLLWHSGLQPSR